MQGYCSGRGSKGSGVLGYRAQLYACSFAFCLCAWSSTKDAINWRCSRGRILLSFHQGKDLVARMTQTKGFDRLVHIPASGSRHSYPYTGPGSGCGVQGAGQSRLRPVEIIPSMPMALDSEPDPSASFRACGFPTQGIPGHGREGENP